MARIAKSDADRVLAQAAKTILEARGGDQNISRASLKKSLLRARVPKKQRGLVDIFFKFIDSDDWKQGETVTESDVHRAVSYAKAHLVEKYDLEHEELSKEELEQMHLVGRRAIDLARALKAAAAES